MRGVDEEVNEKNNTVHFNGLGKDHLISIEKKPISRIVKITHRIVDFAVEKTSHEFTNSDKHRSVVTEPRSNLTSDSTTYLVTDVKAPGVDIVGLYITKTKEPFHTGRALQTGVVSSYGNDTDMETAPNRNEFVGRSSIITRSKTFPELPRHIDGPIVPLKIYRYNRHVIDNSKWGMELQNTSPVIFDQHQCTDSVVKVPAFPVGSPPNSTNRLSPPEIFLVDIRLLLQSAIKKSLQKYRVEKGAKIKSLLNVVDDVMNTKKEKYVYEYFFDPLTRRFRHEDVPSSLPVEYSINPGTQIRKAKTEIHRSHGFDVSRESDMENFSQAASFFSHSSFECSDSYAEDCNIENNNDIGTFSSADLTSQNVIQRNIRDHVEISGVSKELESVSSDLGISISSEPIKKIIDNSIPLTCEPKTNDAPNEGFTEYTKSELAGNAPERATEKKKQYLFNVYKAKNFARIRKICGMSSSNYETSICDTPLSSLGASAAGKSGAILFVTDDKQLVIKTVTKQESELLLGMIQSYERHLRRYRSSLICKIYGLYKIDFRGFKGSTRFIIMNNVMYGANCHRMYDLKGTTEGRYVDVSRTDIDLTRVILKDLNFTEDIWVKSPTCNQLKTQLGYDIAFLRSRDIMDYSLLLGIEINHRDNDTVLDNRMTDMYDPIGRSHDPVETSGRLITTTGIVGHRVECEQDTGMTNLTAETISQENSFSYTRKIPDNTLNDNELPETDSKQLHSRIDDKLRGGVPPIHRGEVGIHELKGKTGPKVKEFLVSIPKYSVNFFKKKVRGTTPRTGEPIDTRIEGFHPTYGNVIYYMGIVDILQMYNLRKKAAWLIKKCSIGCIHEIDTEPPLYYSKRFRSYINRKLVPVEDAENSIFEGE